MVEQNRTSAVGAFGSVDDYEVAYTYEKWTTGRNTIRKTQTTLPSGTTLGYTYRSTGGLLDEDTSRVTRVTSGGVALAEYNYNGGGQVGRTLYHEPHEMW